MSSILNVSPSLPLPLESQINNTMVDLCPPFGPAMYLHKVFSSDRHSRVGVQVQTKIEGSYSLVGNNRVCYLNNYFHVTGSFSLQGIGELYEDQEYPFLVETSTGQLEEIDCFMLNIGAKLFDDDRLVPLAQFTTKREKATKKTPSPITFRPWENLQYSAVGSEQNIAIFERLQFESHTANSGRRRIRDQQNHVVVMELKAKLKTESFVTVVTQTSSPMIVRKYSKKKYSVLHTFNHMANQNVPSDSSYYPSAVPQLNSGHSYDRTPPSSPNSSTSHITEPSSMSSTSRLITPSDSTAKRSSFLYLFPCIGWPF
ncbi:unnamed protein product [Rhizopus stolonifer]